MKIAFTTKGTNWDSMMDPRFGRTQFIMIYDDQKEDMTHYDNTAVSGEAHGAGPKTAQALFELGPQVLITGNGPGGNAENVLGKAGIEIFAGAGEMTVSEAWDAYKTGKLKKF